MPDRPNVLWICTDQQRYDTLGCYGNDFVDTPNVDALADDGVRFETAFCQNPVCAPSRASFLTGRYPRTTGVRGNGQAIPETETLVTRELADAGYVCGLAGKLHISPANPSVEEPPTLGERRIDDGYADFHWSHGTGHPSPANEYRTWLREQGVEYETRPIEGTEHAEYGMPAEYHQTTWCANRAEAFIEEAAERDHPWLFSVNPFDPHHPFLAPEEYLEPYLDRLDDIPLPAYEEGEHDDKPPWYRSCHEGAYNFDNMFPFPRMDDEDHRIVRATYWAMCDLLDDAVGQLLDALERTGQREDTIVIFMSDHGELLGDHGIYLKGPFLYEESMRVPLVVSGPDVQEGVESDALVELVDLAPTLLDAAEVDIPKGMQGRSLWPLLTGDQSVDDHRDSVYAESYDTVHWQSDPSDCSTMLRTGDHKLIRHHSTDQGELYDLREDPNEVENHWNDPDYADVRTDLLEEMTDRMAATVDPLPEREAPW